MSHHSSDFPLNEMQKMREALGPTGEFPEGHYGPHDEGELTFAIAADPVEHKVVIDFGKPIRSLAMTPAQALDLAKTLRQKASKATTWEPATSG